MSHQPPDITECSVANDWSITVKWQLDPILNADPPDSVEVFVDDIQFDPRLPSSSSEATIDSATAHALPGPVLAIRIDFIWSDGVESPQSSPVTLSWPPSQSGSQRQVQGPPVPTIRAVGVTPKTLQAQNAITIQWASNNFTDGRISWGPVGDAAAHVHSIKPLDVPRDYSGSFTTDQPLDGGQRYQLTVAVINSFISTTWVSNAVVVRSAENYHSLAAFLEASGVDESAGLRAAAGGGVLSLTEMFGV